MLEIIRKKGLINMKKRRINLIVTEEFHRRLAVYCAKTDQKIQHIIVKVIEDFLNKVEKQ
jgi:hypothetical protein